MADKHTKGLWFNPIIVDDEPSMTPDVSNPPAHFTNNLDIIKLEDTTPAIHTAPAVYTAPAASTNALANPSPSASTDALASTTIYPSVRYGTMRTRHQLCRLLEDVFNTLASEFHKKIDQAYGQFCLKFSTTQQQYLNQLQPILASGNCFSTFTQIFPSENLTQVMQLMLAKCRETTSLGTIPYV
ncbi:uncharacterized protein FRV6_04673 [Fusarium oxysporum]|uniref:Uncharacterized protein n=1 Tax=Fusarium oxysporum TaxID=5507 RepID=A0A2H3TBX1_FUSOX|nr:hypothetical protein FOMA001_g238 [Fusarium oxysporum f. sp. matthiolae]RKL08398.1 hypothetical protein BFJ71_g1688 [Fusarium oxysporum]RKL09615.1 hypothetical protein BFJ68_g9040 [Fusarium oxysporum]SCO80460.1 uncharacterized protein FRV6_04673 [Fusarium oxysporum]